MLILAVPIHLQTGLHKSYEILCKTFTHEAKAVLEVIRFMLYTYMHNITYKNL